MFGYDFNHTDIQKQIAVADLTDEQIHELEWTGRMNNIRACAKEIVNREIIYA